MWFLSAGGKKKRDAMTSKLRILKAEHGDAIIVSIFHEDILHHIVIDGGPSSKFAGDIVQEIDELGPIDLMVLTHYDDDHIGGLIEFFKKHKNDKIDIKTCWVNCASDVPIATGNLISYSQAKTLENYLIQVSQRQPLDWKNVITNAMETVDLGFCKIQLLSPSPESLQVNYQALDKETKDATISSASFRVKQDEKISLEELAKRPNVKHSANEDIINKSSIAFILEIGLSKILLMGDADPWIVVEKLKEMGYSKSNPLKVDYWKVSHHGSRNNICNDLLDMIKCSNYIFSTNGGKGSTSHPDRETLAKILCYPGRSENEGINFYFNYSLKDIYEKTGVLISESEKEQYRCETFCNANEFLIP